MKIWGCMQNGRSFEGTDMYNEIEEHTFNKAVNTLTSCFIIIFNKEKLKIIKHSQYKVDTATSVPGDMDEVTCCLRKFK